MELGWKGPGLSPSPTPVPRAWIFHYIMLLKALSDLILLWRAWNLQLGAQDLDGAFMCEKEDVDSLMTVRLLSPPSNCASPLNPVCRRPWPARENSCPQHSGGHCNFPSSLPCKALNWWCFHS